MTLSSKDSDVLEPEIDSESENYSGVLNLKNSDDTQKYFQKFNSVFQCSDSISLTNLRNESKEILVEDQSKTFEISAFEKVIIQEEEIV